MMELGVGVGFSDMMESESKIFFQLHNPGMKCGFSVGQTAEHVFLECEE